MEHILLEITDIIYYRKSNECQNIIPNFLKQKLPFSSPMLGSFWDSVILRAPAANETFVIDSLQLLWGLELGTSLTEFFWALCYSTYSL